MKLFERWHQLSLFRSKRLHQRKWSIYRLIWGRFVKWHCRKARNIACDMAQEIFNRVSKDVVKAMGLSRTQKAIERASKAAAGAQLIVKRLNKVSDVKQGRI